MASKNKQGNEKREALADILAEIRDALRNENPWGENDTRTAWINSGSILAYLDRIETAWKREREAVEADALAVGGIVEASRHKPGNAAALREALREAIGETCAGCKRDCDDCMNLKSGWMKKAKAALSAPARNCDVYDPDKAAHMMEVDYCGSMTPSHCDGTNCTRCSFKWFTSPAEKGGAK